MTNHKPARAALPVLTQLCKLIPSHLTASLAKKHGIDKQARTFSAWSHVVSRFFAQLTRAKDNMAYTVRKKLLKKPTSKILSNDLILLKTNKSHGQYPEPFRRLEMLVEVDGKEVVMAFITNNTQWAASSVGELYQARWGIEVFFKQLKQTLQIYDFLGHSKEAISWQLWAVLLLYVLMRWQGQAAGWRLRSCCEDTYLPGFSP